jgi:ribonucleoside-diphosphate reductase beta chain
MSHLFNQSNTEWKDGHHPLFLGQAPGVHDSIHVTYPEIFKLYKLQKSIDWAEDELSLESSRMDMLTCPEEIKDIMLKNLALQWELDSVAARAIAPVFAPFVTNPELWLALLKNTEIEGLHTLTYSEIVRQCIPDPKLIFDEVMKNDQMMGRMSIVVKYLSELDKAGAMYKLGMLTEEEAYPIIMLGWTALYCLERLQFMASFACTFAVVEQGWFATIGKYIQKIMIDERVCHAQLGATVLDIELSTERGAAWGVQYRHEIKDLIDDVVKAEYIWAEYMFSEGRKVVGLNEQKLKNCILYNSYDIYETLRIPIVRTIKEQPIKYMDNWLDLNKFQNAQQEEASANYALNIIIDDIDDNEVVI